MASHRPNACRAAIIADSSQSGAYSCMLCRTVPVIRTGSWGSVMKRDRTRLGSIVEISTPSTRILPLSQSIRRSRAPRSVLLPLFMLIPNLNKMAFYGVTTYLPVLPQTASRCPGWMVKETLRRTSGEVGLQGQPSLSKEHLIGASHLRVFGAHFRERDSPLPMPCLIIGVVSSVVVHRREQLRRRLRGKGPHALNSSHTGLQLGPV